MTSLIVANYYVQSFLKGIVFYADTENLLWVKEISTSPLPNPFNPVVATCYSPPVEIEHHVRHLITTLIDRKLHNISELVTDVLWRWMEMLRDNIPRLCSATMFPANVSLFVLYKTILQNTYRVPDRFDAPESNGIPTKQASNPSAVLWTGSLIIEAIPPERGTSFGLVGKLKSLFKRLQTENWRACRDVLILIRLRGFDLPKKRKTLLDKLMFLYASFRRTTIVLERAWGGLEAIDCALG